MKENVAVVLFPIFLRCCHYLQDPFWVYIFEDLAYGRCPYGIIIQNDCIYSILKNKEFTYSFKEKLPEVISSELSDILGVKLHMLSQQDHFRFRTKYQEDMKNFMDTLSNWNDIKKKNLRYLLLEHYTISKKQQLQYSIAFTRKLYSLIFIGIQFKTILAKHIHYYNRNITHIEGIVCGPKCIRCSYNVFLSKNASHSSIITKSKHTSRISIHWKRYLSTL
jgi:hypothetical protein